MNNEKLIELVREYTFLYDLDDCKYSDNQRKDDAWKEIAKKLKVQEKEDCKKAWALLRDSFRRAIKKRKKIKSGQASVPRKKWKYEDEMSFLLPYFKERPTTCTVRPNHEDEDSGAAENCPDAGTQTKPASPEIPSTVKNTYSISESTPVKKRPQIREAMTSRSSSGETPSNTLTKFMLENKANKNDIQQFFDSIATTVQSFPPRDRAIAKAKVFAVISQMELEILGRDSSTYSAREGSPESYEMQMSEPPNYFFSTPLPQAQSSRLLELNNSSNNKTGLQGFNQDSIIPKNEKYEN